jgi:hypothetical protein
MTSTIAADRLEYVLVGMRAAIEDIERRGSETPEAPNELNEALLDALSHRRARRQQPRFRQRMRDAPWLARMLDPRKMLEQRLETRLLCENLKDKAHLRGARITTAAWNHAPRNRLTPVNPTSEPRSRFGDTPDSATVDRSTTDAYNFSAKWSCDTTLRRNGVGDKNAKDWCDRVGGGVGRLRSSCDSWRCKRRPEFIRPGE